MAIHVIAASGEHIRTTRALFSDDSVRWPYTTAGYRKKTGLGRVCLFGISLFAHRHTA